MTDDDVINPLGLDITEEDIARAEALYHQPDRAEIRELLERYFEPPISEEFVDKIEAEFRQISSSLSDWAGHARSFESLTRWRGRAWYEDFTLDRSSMTPSDLVLMLANMFADHTPSSPQPRLYCPPAFVGTWEQIEPRPPQGEQWLWHLSADGAFRCDDPEVPDTLIRWCVERWPHTTRVSLVLWNEFKGGWVYSQIEPPEDELSGEHLGISGSTPLRLRRVR